MMFCSGLVVVIKESLIKMRVTGKRGISCIMARGVSLIKDTHKRGLLLVLKSSS